MSLNGHGTATALQRLVDALRDHGCLVKESGATTMAQCPAHDDNNPSLSIGARRDGRGAVLKCHAGCEYTDVLAALNMTDSDLFDDPLVRNALDPIKTYVYANGRKNHRSVADGKKTFWQEGSGDKSLFAIDTVKPGDAVYLCEGEKAVELLAAMGHTAVATGGSQRTCDIEPLAGHVVQIIADRDDAGRTWARRYAQMLEPIATYVCILQAAVDIDKADVVEHIAAGYSLNELEIVPITEVNGHEVAPEPPVVPVEYRDGAHLLDMIHEFIGRFVNYPDDHSHIAHTLWIAHTWVMDYWESTPRIAFLSPEPASGKSRALEVTEALVPRPVHSVNVTPAYLFRKVSDPAGPPTILYDEIDTVFGPKAKEHEEIRGLLNSGHRKGAMAGRCVIKGKKIETEEIPSYCAVALAGLHSLPDTILTRSVVIPMRRRIPGERIEPWRMSINGAEAAPLRAALEKWIVAAVAATPGSVAATSSLPEGIEDRDADVWEALIGVGDLAGGHWPATVRCSAVAAVAAFKDMEPSLGVQLLWDIHKIFCDAGHGDLPANVAAVSADLVSNLKGIEEAPWATYGRDRKGLDTLRLSKLLSNYGIKSRNTRIGTTVAKAYHVWQFDDAWKRYGTGPSVPSIPRIPLHPLHRYRPSTTTFGAENLMDIDDRREYLEDIGLELGWNKNLVKCQICRGRWHSAEYETCYDCRPPWLRFNRREFTQDQRIDIMERDNYQCAACEVRDEYLQVDHIKPCALGGEADLWNGQVLCGPCNLKKAHNWRNTRWPEMRIRLMHLYLTFGWPFLSYEERELLVAEASNRRDVIGYHRFSGIMETAQLEALMLEKKFVIVSQTPSPLAQGQQGPAPQFVNVVEGMMEDSRPVFYGDRFAWHSHVSGVREPSDWALAMADEAL